MLDDKGSCPSVLYRASKKHTDHDFEYRMIAKMEIVIC
jgi:hypothetical protein